MFGSYPWYIILLPSLRPPPPQRPALMIDVHSAYICSNLAAYDAYDANDIESGASNKNN